MCVPKGSHREDQLQVQNKVPKSDPQKVITTCDLADQPKKVDPKLIALEVTGANPLGGDRYWVLKDSRAKVRVKAVTEPPGTPVAWSGGTSTSSPIVQEVAASNVADVPVKATLDCEKSVTIEIYDLVSVSCPLPQKNSKYKAYVSNQTTRLTAVTNPDVKKVWDLLVWNEGAAGATKNLNDVDLKPVGDRTVTVALGSKSLPIDLHICQWPRVQVKEVKFECHEVLNDGVTKIGEPFDKRWESGRADPAVNVKTAKSQSPICFTRKKKIKLSAEFEVTEKATDDETVSIKANLGFGEVKADISVAAGADKASMALTESTAALPDKVDHIAAWDITWTHVLEDNANWVDAGTSTSPLYVVLGDPQKPIYFTLLDVSCESAKGKSSPDEVVTESFKPYADARGTGKGFVRKGDGLSMSYYNKGSATGSGSDMQTTDGLLSNAEATGRCGGWATLLRHMWAMHDITLTGRRWYIRADQKSLMNTNLRFLVKNCTFSAKGSAPTEAYTHNGTRAKNEVTKLEGLPGHGQNNPQFDFGDHVVVKYGGKYYDPSYGVGPYDTDDAYLSAALDGLGKHPKIDFVFSGVQQHIPRYCVPYKDGFAEDTIILNPFEFYAQGFKMTGSQLFPFCTFVPPRATLAEVRPGDQVEVVDKGTVVDEAEMCPVVTLADIAAKHSVTEDQVFDHPKNGPLKARRKNKASLKTGDTVVVPFDLDANGKRVFGHDI